MTSYSWSSALASSAVAVSVTDFPASRGIFSVLGNGWTNYQKRMGQYHDEMNDA